MAPSNADLGIDPLGADEPGHDLWIQCTEPGCQGYLPQHQALNETALTGPARPICCREGFCSAKSWFS